MTNGMWIALTAALIASSCALLGSFLIVRRQALLADAVSHAVLPGIVVAWLISGSRDPVIMIIGAAIFAVICVVLVELLEATNLVRTDGAIGLTFPMLFSLGVLGVHKWTENIHLDLDATIYGEIAFIPFWKVELFGHLIPRATLIAGIVFALNILLIGCFWRIFKAASFDPGFSASVGVRVRLTSRILLVATAITAVVAFESVGAILVITLLIVPAAAAFLLTRRLWVLIVIAMAFGWIAAIAGWNLAHDLDASIAGMMGVTCGVLFAISALVSTLRRSRLLSRG